MTIEKRIATALMVASLGLGTGCTLYVQPLPPPDAVFVVREPPPVQREVIIEQPGPAYVWISGYWHWGSNDFAWVPGRWSAPPRGFRNWEPGRWHHEKRGWFWMEGRWR